MAGFFKKLFNSLFPEHMTKEEFIAKAKDVHGNRYDYSKVRYKDEDTRVSITCPKHGKFLVTPKAHIEGEGCEECKKEFISECVDAINTPEAVKRREEEDSTFMKDMLSDIFGPDSEDAEEQYIGEYSDDKTELFKCPDDFSGTYTLPRSVLEISSNAFRGCANLTSIKLSDSLEGIGWNAFEGCTGLTSIAIPDSVERISSMVFSGCVNLKDVILPASLEEIDSHTFNGCKSLKTITIPKGVKHIRSYAFKDCTSLTQITIPEGVEHIHSGAFSGCSNVVTITLPKSIRTLDSNKASLFEGCTNLKEIIVPVGQKQRIADLFWENDVPYKALLIEK